MANKHERVFIAANAIDFANALQSGGIIGGFTRQDLVFKVRHPVADVSDKFQVFFDCYDYRTFVAKVGLHFGGQRHVDLVEGLVDLGQCAGCRRKIGDSIELLGGIIGVEVMTYLINALAYSWTAGFGPTQCKSALKRQQPPAELIAFHAGTYFRLAAEGQVPKLSVRSMPPSNSAGAFDPAD